MPNVTQSGPKGYEYQYLVSLLIGLQQIEINNIELYIEAVGIEDAFLKIYFKDIIKNIEVQVKSEKKRLSLKTLTEWLYHFEEGESNENLLKKVIDGSVALFITQSWCSDDTGRFQKDISDFFPHDNLDIKSRGKWAKGFLNLLTQNSFSKKQTDLATIVHGKIKPF